MRLMKYLYLAGPMTMHMDTDWNYPAFNQAAAYLRSKDLIVVNPAENFDGRTGLPRNTYLRKSIEQVSDPMCGGIVLLPDWQLSDGARMEVTIAMNLNLEVLPYEDLLDLYKDSDTHREGQDGA